jgi:glyoxylase-like metal-dependent hydrolase (beta-lactamase superfamily II)
MQKWRIGEVTVTKIVELEVTGGSRFILPQATYEEILPIGWLQPHFADERGRLKMSIHALIVETPGRRILVDTCLGNDKQGRRIPTWNNLQGPFLADLAAAGYPRESIDTVLHASACRPASVEHDAGDGKWGPTFPRARYLMGGLSSTIGGASTSATDMAAIFADPVRPARCRARRSGRDRSSVSDEISLVPTIGHTPGHVSVRIRSQGEEALITGDLRTISARSRGRIGRRPRTAIRSRRNRPASACWPRWRGGRCW